MSFTAESLEKTLLQGEPDWLRDRRRSALDTYERLPLPSKTDEEWRRTDVSRFNPGEYSRRSEEHTSELQSQSNLVCRLLLEKKKKKHTTQHQHSPHRSTPLGIYVARGT